MKKYDHIRRQLFQLFSMRKRFNLLLAVLGTLSWFPGSLIGESDPLVNLAQPGLLGLRSPSSGSLYRVYVEAEPGEDIAVKLQDAFDAVRENRGGTVVLPPGQFVLSRGVNLAGRLEKFPTGGASNVTFEGNGATLVYKGPDEGAVIDIPGAAFCTVRNLFIQGEREKYWGKVVGVRYGDGIERKVHGGKNNLFEHLQVQNVGVGYEVGGLFGPDLVGGTFINCAAIYLRIGYRFLGQNVTSMVLINPLIAQYEEAGIKIQGFAARKIRSSTEDSVPSEEIPGEPAVLMDADKQKEIFQKDLPDWLTAPDVTYPTFRGVYRDHGPALWAGGGGLDVTIYGLLGHSNRLDSWMLDLMNGNVRVYSARIEGMGGVLLQRQTVVSPHYSIMLQDVGATTIGGIAGNALEIRNSTPVYLIGGSFRANIALGKDATVYTMGTRFITAPHPFTSGLPVDFDESKLDPARFTKTDEIRNLGNLRGKSRIWKAKPIQNPGFVYLPGGEGAQIFEMAETIRKTVKIPRGESKVTVTLEGMEIQSDVSYQVGATAGFNAGSIWFTDKQKEAVTLHFERPPERDASVDLVISRSPVRQYD